MLFATRDKKKARESGKDIGKVMWVDNHSMCALPRGTHLKLCIACTYLIIINIKRVNFCVIFV